MKLSLADVYALIDAVDLKLSTERVSRGRFAGNCGNPARDREERIERLERLRQRLDTEILHLLLPRATPEPGEPRRYFPLVDGDR